MAVTRQELIDDTLSTILSALTGKKVILFLKDEPTSQLGCPRNEYYWAIVDPVTYEEIEELTQDKIKEIHKMRS